MQRYLFYIAWMAIGINVCLLIFARTMDNLDLTMLSILNIALLAFVAPGNID